MELLQDIRRFLQRPSPVWDEAITKRLVELKWRELLVQGKIGGDGRYSTVKMFGKDCTIADGNGFQTLSTGLPVELPDDRLKALYLENGLDVLAKAEVDRIAASEKINRAFSRLLSIGGCGKSVASLVKALQVLRQPQPEFDVSYSHPGIPFTIFVSVGQDPSEIESLRLSESILHESIHLLLSLIEERLILVNDNESIYYSPWRETERPLRGVLHSMFVFRAVMEYYRSILPDLNLFETRDFAEFRIEQITAELMVLKDFAKCGGLSEDGASLAAGLLPLS